MNKKSLISSFSLLFFIWIIGLSDYQDGFTENHFEKQFIENQQFITECWNQEVETESAIMGPVIVKILAILPYRNLVEENDNIFVLYHSTYCFSLIDLPPPANFV